MKKLILLATLLLLLSSCSDEVLSKDGTLPAQKVAGADFTFASVTEPSNWAQYQSLEEMLAACQIHDGQLKAMTTEQLIKTCFSHPLRLNYLSYNNEIAGAKVIIDNFNGFRELKSRTDGAEKIIDFYETVNFDPQAKDKLGADYRSELPLGFIELALASNYIPEVFEGANRDRIEDVAEQVLQQKLSKNDKSIFGIRHTMLVGAQAKLASENLNTEERSTLACFIDASGMTQDAESYTKVSLIIAK